MLVFPSDGSDAVRIVHPLDGRTVAIVSQILELELRLRLEGRLAIDLSDIESVDGAVLHMLSHLGRVAEAMAAPAVAVLWPPTLAPPIQPMGCVLRMAPQSVS